MRILAALAVLVFAQIGAAWATGDLNTARIGGVLATPEADNAEACLAACRDDTLCMAWTFEAGACQLSANVPPAVPRAGAVSGLSLRAPAHLRTAPPTTVAATAPAELPSIQREDEVLLEAHAELPEDDLSAGLLGGPIEEDLRSRLGN